MRQTSTLCWRALDLNLAYQHSGLSGPTEAGRFHAVSKASSDDNLLEKLGGRNILIVEDEVLVAMDIEYALSDLGANVIGPAPTLANAMDYVSSGNKIDAAILDIDLAGEDVFPAAAVLHQRDVPFLFHTGHGLSIDVSTMFPTVQLCTKPMKMNRLLAELAALLKPRPS